jgi:hypothetical protein
MAHFMNMRTQQAPVLPQSISSNPAELQEKHGTAWRSIMHDQPSAVAQHGHSQQVLCTTLL